MSEWEFLFAQVIEGFTAGRLLEEPEIDDQFYMIGHEAGVLFRIQRDTRQEESTRRETN